MKKLALVITSLEVGRGVEMLDKWLDEELGDERIVFVKRLAANDTLATKAHQAGPYLPKEAVDVVAPGLLEERTLNPRRLFKAHTDSQPTAPCEVSLIWYNNRLVEGKTRNECRLTGWGGRESPVLDPESTGAIAVFSFVRSPATVRVWVCRSVEEEDVVEAHLGVVEPGRGRAFPPIRKGESRLPAPRREREAELIDFPAEWKKTFPTGSEIAALAASKVELDSAPSLDIRLVRRREVENVLFDRLEEIHTLPLLKKPFKSVKAFRAAALSVLQRAKARSGGSLELHIRRILDEERIPYDHPGRTEGKKKPDFLLPSNRDYADMKFPAERLRILAAKTTLKDRWRQVLNEADRVKKKHLITLQQGVSEEQFKEMVRADLQLVVPRPLHTKYPKSVRPELTTLDDFVAQCRALAWKTGAAPLLLLTDGDNLPLLAADPAEPYGGGSPTSPKGAKKES